MAKRKLGDSTLFQTTEITGGGQNVTPVEVELRSTPQESKFMSVELTDVEKERQALGIEPIKKSGGAPRNEALIRKKGVQQGLPEDLQRTTVILPVELVNKMRDYSYTERITLKEAYTRALEAFLADKTDLLNHEDKR